MAARSSVQIPAPAGGSRPPSRRQAKPRKDVQEQRLRAVFEVARILASGYSLDEMLPMFLSCLIRTLDVADIGMLFLYDPAEERLVVRGVHGYDLPTLQRLRLAPGESMSGKVFQTGRAELYPTPSDTAAAMANMSAANREILAAATIGQRPPLSAICVPLIAGQDKLGVLILENLQQPGSFTQSDLAFLQSVADLMAVAVKNIQLQEELRTVQAMEEANRLKAELISTLAHEMRTPLTSIKGYSTALLMDEAAFSPETQREFLQIIDEETDILQDLIHDLLESSVIDAGLLKLEPQPVLLPRLVAGVIEELCRRSPKHRFVVDFPTRFPVVEADPLRIAQVLRNLLDNAVKYSPPDSLVVVRGEVHPEEVVVSVADQGEGIAPEHMNRLFEKFFRARSGLGQHRVGSGLGLPIARTIIESHGGRIWAESRLGEGTTLFFTLPLRKCFGEVAR